MRLFRWFLNQGQKGAQQTNLYQVYVRCSRCGEVIKTQVNVHNDLSIHYGGEGQPDSYFTRKSLVGNSLCFAPIEIELKFDTKMKLLSQNIHGGEFLLKQEYLRSLVQ
jgi:hypothetical protein